MAALDYGMPKDVVPPGDQTGVYYIPISNLPFTASWQQIKDYVRQVCDVDHVEIFQKSTSGWVRVNGRENFDAAFRHLNGKEFNGRAIFADGRNGENPMLVRDLKVCKPTGPPSNHPSSDGGSSGASDTAFYATGGPVSYPDSSMYSSSTSTGSSSYSQVGLNSHSTPSSYSSSSHLQQQDLQPRQYQCRVSMPAANELMMPHRFEQNAYNMPMSASSYMTTPDMTFSQGLVTGYDSTAGGGFSHPNAYGYGSVQPAAQPQAFMSTAYPPSLADGVGPQTLYNAPASYAVQPPTYHDYYPPAPTSSAATTASALAMQMSTMALGNGNSGGGGGDVIYTEQRGVHIRDISRRASEDQIRKLIREVTGPEAALIETIRVPKNEGGALRGHAFVHLRSASLAWRLVEHLNGCEFKGRKLQVRLMKEGDAIYSGAGAGSATAAASSSLAPASSSSSSSKQRGASKHHHHHHHHQHQHQHQSRSHHAAVSDRSSSRRTEREERDRPEKSNSASSTTKTTGSGSKASGPLVVGTPVTASAAAKEKQYGKKSVVIADGSSTGRRSG